MTFVVIDGSGTTTCLVNAKPWIFTFSDFAYRKLARHPILCFPALWAVTPLMPTGLVTNPDARQY
jgi:hypothetical protein